MRVRSALWSFLVLSMIFVQMACQTSQRNRYRSGQEEPEIAPLVDPRYSLTADRAQLDEIRKQVPAQKKTENDEEALILQLTSDAKKSPAQVRSVFDQMMRKKRELLDRDLKKERETFNQQERKVREAFLKEQSKARESSQTKRMSRDQRTDFFKDQDLKRRDHFANERERREDFESQTREKRKNFEDYARAKTNEFNAEMLAYQKTYDEARKEEKRKADGKAP